MKPTVRVIKIGGNVLNKADKLDAVLTRLASYEHPQVLVHGGGRDATLLAEKMGIHTEMINGRRITTAEMVDVVTMVYAGRLNKGIVASLQAKGKNAIGLSGADLNMIQAHKRPVKDIDYGFAGDIDMVNGNMLQQLITLGALPVLCSITHDKKGQLLNTNADTIATETAIALSSFFETELLLLFEKPGVLSDAEDDQSVIQVLNPDLYNTYKEQGIIFEGMIPKLDNAFYGIDRGIQKVRIGSMELLSHEQAGTLISNS